MRKPVNAGMRRVIFEFTAEPGSTVALAGSFNDWDPAAKQLSDRKGTGAFSATVFLPRGRHEYKYVVNGQWCVDPECADWVPNSHGSLNSVITVQ
jgi:1,4-alpha-glucan branching enzyme